MGFVIKEIQAVLKRLDKLGEKEVTVDVLNDSVQFGFSKNQAAIVTATKTDNQPHDAPQIYTTEALDMTKEV